MPTLFMTSQEQIARRSTTATHGFGSYFDLLYVQDKTSFDKAIYYHSVGDHVGG